VPDARSSGQRSIRPGGTGFRHPQVIPVKEDQKKHRRDRGRAGGRPPDFDPGWYKKRNTVERCFSKLKQFRAVATRYDKRERIYQGTIDVASISIWLRDPVP
jgi:transposase